ncbi:hypothetical protein [Thiohalobacter thiocyanaticus]|uniref:Uncharacterized protein n=1 Tax=Thiohalobacter thiocyanaticus TaxID=585455 RepID=A0A426QML6_9GAMM|nr:hypothetical protein [Thiohalobacter thiocyanaticus]RRQ22916.1 hypothetical protein D6C00_13920 [Thiohalobacter thiocyanaticus]
MTELEEITLLSAIDRASKGDKEAAQRALRAFVDSVRAGDTPHPALLEYLAGGFVKGLASGDMEQALNLKYKQEGNPGDSKKAQLTLYMVRAVEAAKARHGISYAPYRNKYEVAAAMLGEKPSTVRSRMRADRMKSSVTHRESIVHDYLVTNVYSFLRGEHPLD